MPWIIGGAIGVSALLGKDATEDAASGQASAAGAATAEQRRQFDISREDLAPFRDAGGAAVNRLSSQLGLNNPALSDVVMVGSGGPVLNPKYKDNPDVVKAWDETLALHRNLFEGRGYWERSDPKWITEQITQRVPQSVNKPPAEFAALNRQFTMRDFENDPVNQIQGSFMQDEARKAIERRAAAMGGWDSGATLKALTRFGSDYGNQRAGESYNRFVGDQTTQFNRLASVAGLGQTSANQTATLGANMANNIGANTMAAANARGAAGVAGANAITGGVNSGLNFFQGQQFLNRLTPPPPQVPAWNPFATGDFPMQPAMG